jgi:hypothetical protein
VTDSASGRVSIERFNSQYVVSREHPAPDHVRVRLDDVMRTHLADACRETFARTLDPNDPSVWLIRRLDVIVALGADALQGDQCTHDWGAEIASSLTRTIARGADGLSVLHFSDRAAYLAHFLGDLASGRSWDRWYYGEFETLRALPTSAAIRETLLREPQLAEAVLLGLGSATDRLVNVLTESDALRFYDLCGGPAGIDSDVPRSIVEAALAAWPALVPPSTFLDISAARTALRLYLVLRRDCPNAGARSVRSAVDSLLGFARLVRRLDHASELIEHLRDGDLRSAVEVARRSGGTLPVESLLFARRIAMGDTDLFTNILRTLAPASISTPQRFSESAGTLEAFSTAFGGAFLLLPKLLELGVHDVIENAPYVDSGDKTAAALRALVLLKGLGRERANAAVCDPAVSLAAGTESVSITETLERLADKAATDAANEACLGRFLDGFVASGRLDLRYLHAELIADSLVGLPVLLIRDLVTDTWLYAATVSDGDAPLSAAVDHGLGFVHGRTGTTAECVLVDRSLAGSVVENVGTISRERFVWVQPSPALELMPISLRVPGATEVTTVLVSPAARVSAQVRATLGAHLRRVRSGGAELDYLSFAGLPGRLETNARFDLLWSLIARAVLRSFASRLVGFARSGPEHLYANFLEGRSFVQSRSGADGEELLVDLPRVPLHLILRMAGVDGQTYRIPWLGDLQVMLLMRAE